MATSLSGFPSASVTFPVSRASPIANTAVAATSASKKLKVNALRIFFSSVYVVRWENVHASGVIPKDGKDGSEQWSGLNRAQPIKPRGARLDLPERGRSPLLRDPRAPASR